MSPQVKTPGALVIQLAITGDVAAIGQLQTELLDRAGALRAEEAHGQQHEVGVQSELGAGNRLEVEPAALAHHLDIHPVQLLHAPARRR